MINQLKEEKSKKTKKKKSYNYNPKVQTLLIENFAGLQKAMTNMAIRFETLSTQMSNLLEIFELSAKNFVSQAQPQSGPEENKDILNKVDSLLEQNKLLAKGLVTLEEKLRQRSVTGTAVNPNYPPRRPQI